MVRRQIYAITVALLALVMCRRTTLLIAAKTPPEKQVGFGILEDWDKGDPMSDVAKDFALFHDLGITTWRGSFGWDDYEPSRGVYDFEWLHEFADLAERYGITLRPYLAYTPAWAAAGGTDKDAWNDPPRNIDDWSAFVGALAAAMKRHPNIASYEIYNEENAAQWWDGSPSAYAQVLERASTAIRSASPGTPVLLGGMVYPDPRWIQHVCAEAHEGDRFAVVPFHAYPETWTPPEVDLEHYLGPRFEDGFVATVDRDCGRKPIWINETGFATVDGKSEHEQAAWWTRAIATFASEPRVEHIGVYEIKDLRPDSPAIGGTPNYHLGITRVDRTRKLAFQTIRDLAALLDEPFSIDDGNVRVTDRAGNGRELYEHALRRHDGREIVFVWTKGAGRTVDVRLPRKVHAAREHYLDGSAEPYADFDGRTLKRERLEAGRPRTFELLP